jgi:phosphoserine phosphatase RsbU/P
MFASKFGDRSLAYEFGFRLGLALSTTLMCAGILYFAVQSRGERIALHNQIKTDTRELAGLLALPLWTFNETEIKSLIMVHARSPEIGAITILDDEGKTITSIQKPGTVSDLSFSKGVIYKGYLVGKVKILASSKPLYLRAIQNLALTGILTLAAIFVTALLIRPLVARFLDDPLQRLAAGIQKIASGRYQEKLISPPQRELSRIVNEVNFMAEKIESRELQIKETMVASTQLQSELAIAETIQRSMIATAGVNAAKRVSQFYQPMANLSGDWMTTFECDNGMTIYAIVGDVTGHGIPQGLVTMAAFGSLQTLRPLIQENSPAFTPATILNILRTALTSLLHECSLAMTVSIIKIDLLNRQVIMSSAGHPLPILIRPTDSGVKTKTLTAKPQSPLGYEFLFPTSDLPSYQDTVHELEDNDIVCLFSDGLTEALNKQKKPFINSFIRTLRTLDHQFSPPELVNKILRNFDAHTEGVAVSDDICLLVIETKREKNHDAVA